MEILMADIFDRLSSGGTPISRGAGAGTGGGDIFDRVSLGPAPSRSSPGTGDIFDRLAPGAGVSRDSPEG